MVVIGGVVDFVDGINHIDNILYGHGLVGTQYHCSLTVVSDFGVDEVDELGLVSWVFVNKILELFVDVDGDGLLGHGLTAA